jgi:hypothetical protein
MRLCEGVANAIHGEDSMQTGRSRTVTIRAGGLAAALLLAPGCTIALKDPPLDPPSRTYADPVRAAASSEGIEGMVGWGRLSLFYIPVAPIFVVDDTTPSQTNTRAQIANREVMKQVRRALAHVGYQVEVVETGASATGPMLVCHVEHFRFNNYTWLAPFVPTWGSAKLKVDLVGSNGAVLWSRGFEGSGFSLNFFDGFSSAANESMQEVLDQMVEAFSSEEFHAALVAES